MCFFLEPVRIELRTLRAKRGVGTEGTSGTLGTLGTSGAGAEVAGPEDIGAEYAENNSYRLHVLHLSTIRTNGCIIRPRTPRSST